MRVLRINAHQTVSELLELADILKRAIVTTAAALLSRTSKDVHENTELTLGHLALMGRHLDGLKNHLSQQHGVSMLAKLKGELIEIDYDAFLEELDAIDRRTDFYGDVLFKILEEPKRESFDELLEIAGALGRAVQRPIELIVEKPMPDPFYFESFLNNTMDELSKKDWSALGS